MHRLSSIQSPRIRRSGLLAAIVWRNAARGIAARRPLLRGFCLIACFALCAPGIGAAQDATPLMQRPDVAAFIDEMVTQHSYPRDALIETLQQTKLRDDIIAAMMRPAEAKPWRDYRKIFLTPERIKGGAEFMKTHAAVLARAHKTYGVPPEIITAIIGVETRYGKIQGRHRVMDALATLAFNYPPRAKYFRNELTQFLLMTREENVDPLTLQGSYAGAMGQPQFMPTSFRKFAVDFDSNGKRDLWTSPEDIIGSVAHYFAEHGWKAGELITRRAKVKGTHYQQVVAAGMKPSYKFKELKPFGVTITGTAPADAAVALIRLEGEKGDEYWVAFGNFYTITRYNHSALYAMATTQLSEAIVKAAQPPAKPKAKAKAEANTPKPSPNTTKP